MRNGGLSLVARGAALFDERAHLLGHLVVDRLHQLAVRARAEQRADRRVVVGAEQDDLGELGAERLQRAREQSFQRVGDLARARECAVGLVEELQALVALALGEVRAVGDEQGRAGDHEQRQRLRVGRREHRGAQSQARVAHRHEQVHEQHPPDGAHADHALRQRDRTRDQQHGEEPADLHRDQRRDPGERPDPAGRRERVHHDQR